MTRRAPPAFDVVTGKIDRDRNRARSLEQAKHIEASAYHAAQARLFAEPAPKPVQVPLFSASDDKTGDAA